MDDETVRVIVVALGASILTGGFTFGVAVYAAKRARDADRLADKRSLLDQRRVRLRDDYVAVLFAADTIRTVSRELRLLWTNETLEVRNERLNSDLQDATENLGRCIGRLKLESGAQPVIDSYSRIQEEFRAYFILFGPSRHWSKPIDHADAQVPLVALMRATGSSKRCVWLIRRGGYVPHPRHWEALRSLVTGLM